jgi:hypothetical protein
LQTGHRQYLLAYLLALPIAIAAALLQPIWNPIDEAAHFDLIDQYAHGVPAAVSTAMRPETVSLMRVHGVNPGVQLAMPPQTFVSPPTGVSEHARAVWLYRHIWQYSDEAFEPPLYYLAAVPFWLAGDALSGPTGALYAVRLLNAFLYALLAPITLALCRLLLPTARRAPWLAAGLAAAMPGSVYNGTHVSNDGLATVGGSGLLLFAAWRSSRGWGSRSSLLAGALLGVALLVKPTIGGIAVAIVVAMLISPTSTMTARLAHVALAASGSAAVFLPWLLANRLLFGSFTQFREPQSLLTYRLVPPQPVDLLQQLQQLLAVSFDFWGLGLFALVMVILSVFAIPGIARLLLEKPGGAGRLAVAVCLAGLAGQAAFAYVVPLLAGSGSPSPGRYYYPALAGAFALLVAGWWQYRLPRPAAIALVGIALLSLAAGLPGRVVTDGGHPVSRFGDPAPGASSTGLRGQAAANGFTVQVDAVRYDATTQALWLHVIAANQSATEPVEWTPTPRLILDGSAVAVARLSYGFTADTLAPGDAQTGWVAVPVERAQLAAARSIAVSFSDVADQGYQVLTDLQVTLCSGTGQTLSGSAC